MKLREMRLRNYLQHKEKKPSETLIEAQGAQRMDDPGKKRQKH